MKRYELQNPWLFNIDIIINTPGFEVSNVKFVFIDSKSLEEYETMELVVLRPIPDFLEIVWFGGFQSCFGLICILIVCQIG